MAQHPSRGATSAKPSAAGQIVRAAHRAVRYPRVLLENLESRRLLSTAPGSALLNGILTVTGTKKADVIVVAHSDQDAQGSSGDFINVAMNGLTTSFAAAGVTQVVVMGGSGNDSISSEETTHPLGVPFTVHGGKGNDAINGTQGNDALYGDAGNDTIIGGAGNDYIDGGKGNDRLLGGAGTDVILANSGRDLYNVGPDGEGDSVSAARKSINSPQANVGKSLLQSRAVPLTAFGSVSGLTPDTMRSIYGFTPLGEAGDADGAGQGIAIVIPYSTPLITNSLSTFSTAFGLPQPDINHFQVISATGGTVPIDPDPNHGWEAEACTDVEWAHAIAPNAKIYLIQAQSDLFPDLFVAVDKATDTLVANHGGGVVALTVGSVNGELNPILQAQFDISFTRSAAQNVTFVAGAGDQSNNVSYPAISPYVTAVGGTSLGLDVNGNFNGLETTWANSGGGASNVYPAPAYQQKVGLIQRSNPDVSYNADPNVGIAVFDLNTFGDVNGDGISDSGWVPGGVGGTSAAAPQWAGLVALANQLRINSGREYIGTGLNSVMYDLAVTYPNQYFHDITTGAAGGRIAGLGYDDATGLGSPIVGQLLSALTVAEPNPLNQNIDVSGSAQLPIALTLTAANEGNPLAVSQGNAGGGPVGGQAGGYFTGRGTASGGSTLNITISPRAQYGINIVSFNINPIVKDARTGKFSGLGTAVVQVPVSFPSISGDGTADLIPPPPNVFAPPPPPSPPPPPATPPASGTGGTTNINPDPGATGFTFINSTLVFTVKVSIVGKVYRGESGVQHITGSFINVGSTSKEPKQGLDFIFRGKFHD